MPKTLGTFSYIASIFFATALASMLYEGATTTDTTGNPALGYFGFGVGIILLGGGTFHLWHENILLERLLGWTSTLFALAISSSLLLMLIHIVAGHPSGHWLYVPAHLLAMLTLGGAGVYLVRQD